MSSNTRTRARPNLLNRPARCKSRSFIAFLTRSRQKPPGDQSFSVTAAWHPAFSPALVHPCMNALKHSCRADNPRSWLDIKKNPAAQRDKQPTGRPFQSLGGCGLRASSDSQTLDFLGMKRREALKAVREQGEKNATFEQCANRCHEPARRYAATSAACQDPVRPSTGPGIPCRQDTAHLKAPRRVWASRAAHRLRRLFPAKPVRSWIPLHARRLQERRTRMPGASHAECTEFRPPSGRHHFACNTAGISFSAPASGAYTSAGTP